MLNISVVGIKPETFLHALEKYEVYISTQTACSSEKAISQSVLSLTQDEERAKSSLRISLSYKTTKEELEEFLKIFKLCLKELTLK
jgi:cysteine desulfurase